MRIIIAWIKKYILHVHSPSAHAGGYDFEYDYIKDMNNKRIRDLESQITELNLRINELEAELEESRAKEGKGCLETVIENITQALASLDFTSMVSAKIESAHCNILDADCPDDCDFDCEHCEHARIDIEEDNS